MGDGILSWRVVEGGIHHPILLKRIELTFDPEKPEFTLAETESAPELCAALFSANQRVDGRSLQNRIEELALHGYHPLDPDAGAYLKGVLGSTRCCRCDFIRSAGIVQSLSIKSNSSASIEVFDAIA